LVADWGRYHIPLIGCPLLNDASWSIVVAIGCSLIASLNNRHPHLINPLWGYSPSLISHPASMSLVAPSIISPISLSSTISATTIALNSAAAAILHVLSLTHGATASGLDRVRKLADRG
jgi:hypothetical protein